MEDKTLEDGMTVYQEAIKQLERWAAQCEAAGMHDVAKAKRKKAEQLRRAENDSTRLPGSYGHDA